MRKEIFDESFAAIPESVKRRNPYCSVILGSGWSKAVESLKILEDIPYSSIPHFGQVAVIGHSGRMLVAEIPGRGNALLFCGRRHWYEGVEWETVLMPVEISRRLNVRTLLITNAAGGINESYTPGDIVIITDHIRLNSLSPLRGEHIPEFGPRFPDQSAIYNYDLVKVLESIGEKQSLTFAKGIYLFSCGPAFETPAEIRAYRILGADLVGMSTVPEAMFASACGIRVAAVSFVSNMAAGITEKELSGAEVIECAEQHAPSMASLILTFLKTV